MNKIGVKELGQKTKIIRKDILRMVCNAGSGHPGGSLSAVEILTTLYFNVLRHRPKKDRFILSKGHACPVLYSTLARSGYFPVKELMTLRKLDSRLQGHPDRNRLPGVEVSTGSLGQGLSIACGMALGLRLNKKDGLVYCLMGDGEINEGQIWEAAMTAAHYKVKNLCGIVDVNGLQSDGRTCDVMNSEPLSLKWQAFGWNVIEVNGHSIKELLSAFNKFKKQAVSSPTLILARTTKGKGVGFMENQCGWHGKAPKLGEIKDLLLNKIKIC